MIIFIWLIMDTPQVYDIKEGNSHHFKKHLFKSMEDDCEGAFSQTPNEVLHIEYITDHIHYKYASIGNANICNDNL